MPVIKTYDLQSFKKEFELYNRQEHFTSEALEIIFDYLNQDDNTFNMDVIGFCREFQEMTEAEIRHNYDIEDWQEIEDYLNDETSVVVVGKTENSFVFVQF
jgi:hypothetical protein